MSYPGTPVRLTLGVPRESGATDDRSRSRGLSWLARLEEERRGLVRYWPVVLNLVGQELRVRYHRSTLGFFWTLVNPILMMSVMSVVFSQFFHIKNYALFLFAGMVPWNFLSAALNDCAYAFITHENLIRKIYVPKLVFPLSRVLICLTTFVLSMAALFVLLKPLGARFTLPMVLLPVVIVLFALFALGLGLAVATVNTFFRDCGHLIAVFLQAWYFATPIIYDGAQCSALGQRLFWLNPAYPFIRCFQVIVCDGAWPGTALLAVSALTAAVSLGVGYALFKSQEDKLVFRL
jgi:ABC-2 type transport system permease protein/lipopolysaccharide transport system permease protein